MERAELKLNEIGVDPKLSATSRTSADNPRNSDMKSRQDLPRGIDWYFARDVANRLAGQNAAHHEYKRLMRATRVYTPRLLDELREHAEDELIRDIIQQISKEAERLGLTQKVLVNITERTRDGHGKQAYDEWGCLTPGQKADFVKDEFEKGHRQMRKAYKFHDRATEEHGVKYTQLFAGFMFPDRSPPPPEPRPDDEPDDERSLPPLPPVPRLAGDGPGDRDEDQATADDDGAGEAS